MIVAKNLTRNYGAFTAVDDVSFKIEAGEIVGLLGHNGAGKTTIMKILTGFLEPTAGSVEIDGHDMESERSLAQSSVGYLPENCPLYPEMSVVEFLDYAAELKGVADDERSRAITESIAATELGEKAMEPISSLSRGYRQRVGVAQAILHNPKIVILDEPTNGLDPSQIKHMRDLIRRLAETATVILSTHILQEVAAVCGRVIVVNRGKVALDSALSDLRRDGRLRLVTNGSPDIVQPLIAGLSLVKSVEILPSQGRANAYGLQLNGRAPDEVAPKVARAINDNGLELFSLHAEQRDLETMFAEITAGSEMQEVAHV
jgi:ABC-2 type transport system ATP-binding protein